MRNPKKSEILGFLGAPVGGSIGEALAALAFLLGHVAARGRPLKAGMIVTTGASTGIHDIAAGQTAHVDFGRFGAIDCVAVTAR